MREPDELALDATCGGRSIWEEGNKHRDDVLYIDSRERPPGFAYEGRSYAVQPDEVQDFRDLPYSDESFRLVVFDPPHIVRKDGMENLNSIMKKKYGAMDPDGWRELIRDGFEELWRVLENEGVMVFKFADNDISFTEVLDVIPEDPWFGTRSRSSKNSETRWFLFMKTEEVKG